MNRAIKKDGFVSIGKIVKSHGLKGAVKVCFYADSFRIFKDAETLLIIWNDGIEKTFKVKSVNSVRGTVILYLDGITDRERGEKLLGGDLFVKKSILPKPDEGEYYWFDLIGSDVITLDKKHIGRIESIVPTGSNDVYVVKGQNSETLVPALESVVLSVDIENKVIYVDLPTGL